MISLRASMLGLAILAGSTVSALAADLGNFHDDEAGVSSGARFYLRGDADYSWFRKPSMSENGLDVSNVSMGANWGFGGGVGVYLSPNWRMDITGEHRNDDAVSGTVVSSNKQIAGSRDFKISSNAVLANLYYDFSGRAGFNPYLGVGIGWASNHTHNGSAVNVCGCVSSIEAATQSNFAWALMAGVTRELDHGFNLDVGYRMIDLGTAHTGNLVLSKTGVAIGSTGIESSAIYANEVRVGLRYDIF